MRNEMDRLSELPDDILVSIISRLSFEEATATSILSTRWRHIYTLVISLNVLSLDFHFAFKPYTDYYNCPYKQKTKREERESVFSAYISSINHAIDSYRGGVMHASNVFRVHTPCLGDSFYKWFDFALSRKVEIIDLDITCHHFDRCYNFVPNLITRSNKQSLLGVKELSLSSIYLKEENMELILSNFVLLEHLSINSPRLSWGLRVVGHCKLKHLHISNIKYSELIEIRDMTNLVSLRFYKLDKYALLLDRVPNLVQFINDDGRYILPDNNFPKISSIYHQLLHLKLLSISLEDIKRKGLTFTKLTKLKHVELKIFMASRSGTRQLFPLIESCPSLEKLEIEFSWASTECKDIYRMVNQNHVKRRKLNNSLKNVRLSGYFGSDSELEFLIYVVKKAVALQELVIEVWDINPEIRQEALSGVSRHLRFLPLNSINIRII